VPNVPNRPDDARRPTKAERKEQARLEREAIQRQMATRKRNRTIGLSLVALAAVIVIVAVVVLQPGEGGDPSIAAPADLLSQAPDAAQAAGCSDVETTDFYDGFDQASPDYADQAHIGGDARFPELPPLDTYPSTPPASGPHVGESTLPAGVYDSTPDIGPLIHSLEHGGSVVWLSPDAPQEAVDEITAFYDQTDPVGQDRVIVATYDYEGPGGQLPDGVQMALVGWRRLQTCASPSLPVAFDFTSQYSYPTTQDREYAGEAPERGASM
jgi:Protein of unknown function (DUF3105)